MLVYSPNGLGSKSKACHPFKTRITSKGLGLIAKMPVRGNMTQREMGTAWPCSTLTHQGTQTPETGKHHSTNCLVPLSVLQLKRV